MRCCGGGTISLSRQLQWYGVWYNLPFNFSFFVPTECTIALSKSKFHSFLRIIVKTLSARTHTHVALWELESDGETYNWTRVFDSVFVGVFTTSLRFSPLLSFLFSGVSCFVCVLCTFLPMFAFNCSLCILFSLSFPPGQLLMWFLCVCVFLLFSIVFIIHIW